MRFPLLVAASPLPDGFPVGESAEALERFGVEDVLRGWQGFTDVWYLLDTGIVLVVAVLLGAAIAYHPLTRSKASSIEELEQPKTFTMYALVGALCAQIVQVNATMGLVVFGIGGLLRFRTNVGPAKDTGRLILAAVVGMCCGLKLIAVAFFATALGWLVMWYLERQDIGRVLVQGVAREIMPRTADAYRKVLKQAGCKLLGERKRVNKGEVEFIVRAPATLDRETLDRQVETAIPEELRGSYDWETS